MKFSCDVDVDIDANELANKIENSQSFWIFAAGEWHRLITPWYPYRTGKLMNDVTIEAKKIEYNVDYAKYVYEMEHANFNKSVHPLATAKWDEAARPSQESKLYDALQQVVDSGAVNLNV